VRGLGLTASAVVLAWAAAARAESALGTLAPEVARSLGAVPANAIVVAAPLASDVPAPKGDELAARLAALIAGKLGPTAHSRPESAPLSVARAAAAKGGALVYMQAEIVRGALRVTADLYPVLSNAWDRVRVPTPPPRAHAFASAPLDAEVRTFLTPVVLEQARVHKVKHDVGEVLAAACGDLDGDGGMELVLATRERVVWGHIRGTSLVVARSASWRALGARAPVPMREPIATLAVAPARGRPAAELLAGITDRGGIAVSADLLASAPLSGMPLGAPGAAGCALPDPAASAFASPLIDCRAARDARDALELPVARFDAFAGAELVGKDGIARALLAMREPGGKLTLRFGDSTLGVDDVGAQLAVGDLDQDGAPDIVTTADASEDAIIVSTWRGTDLKPRLTIPAPAGVRALAVCPPEVRGLPALVAVVGEEVWVVR
jgi:hypothetical protein